MKVLDILSEGPNDPHIFKAIFLAGGPGSGKSFVSGRLLSGTGLRVVNSDDIYEYMMKKAGMELDPETIFSPAGQSTRERAKAITKRKQSSHIDGRLGLIIDGTGKDVAKYAKTKKMLEDLGYDTMMLFVNTSLDVAQERNMMRPRKLDSKVVEKMWNAVQQNIMAFQQVFGAANFYVVDNSGGLEDPSRKENFTRIQKSIDRFINSPPNRREARAWLAAQKPSAKQTNESTGNNFDIDEVLEQITELMDDIDSDSILSDDPEYTKMLERDYRALHAVENVLKNNKIANERGNKDSIFHYDIDPEYERYGAIHVKITGDTAEIVWLGSYNSSGKKLYNDVKPQLKQQGVKKVKLTTKWESEGFYTKLGFSQDSDTVSNPIAGSSNTNMSMKLENSPAPSREITQADLQKLEFYADKIFRSVGIDVEFTRHFLDRANDERNIRQITLPELAVLFRDEYARWGKKIARLGPDAEAVMKDMRSDINIPFALNWDPRNKELDLVAKTVMRKKNFRTPNPEFPVEGRDPNQLRGKDRAKTVKPSTTGSQPHPFKGKLVGNSQ